MSWGSVFWGSRGQYVTFFGVLEIPMLFSLSTVFWNTFLGSGNKILVDPYDSWCDLHYYCISRDK